MLAYPCIVSHIVQVQTIQSQDFQTIETNNIIFDCLCRRNRVFIMKQFFRFFVVAIALVAWLPAHAQKSVVKDVKKIIKKESADVDKYRRAQKQIVPALSHNETKDNAETWFVAGKVMYGLTNSLATHELLFGDDSEAIEKCHALIDGYAYMQHALQLDSIHGKPKYSKDIWAMINWYIDDYKNFAMQLMTANDFEGAYKLFDIFCDLSPEIKSAADIAEARFYQMTAAQRMKQSDSSFTDVLKKLLNAKQYDIAYAFIDQASDYLGDEAKVYDMKALVAEYQNDIDAAILFGLKAVEINSADSQRLFNLGRLNCLKAEKIIQDNPNSGVANLKSQLQPLYEVALRYFNKATDIDPENRQALRLIDEVMYRLKMLNHM